MTEMIVKTHSLQLIMPWVMQTKPQCGP